MVFAIFWIVSSIVIFYLFTKKNDLFYAILSMTCLILSINELNYVDLKSDIAEIKEEISKT